MSLQHADANNHIRADKIIGSGGSLHFVMNKQRVAESKLPDDFSYVHIGQSDGAYTRYMAGGAIRMEAPSDLSLNSNNNTFFTVNGTRQTVVGRNDILYIKGDQKILIGTQGEKEKKAAEDLQRIVKQAVEVGKQVAKETVDDKIKCPVCNSKTLVDQKSKIPIKFQEATAWIYKHIPKMAFPLETIIQIFEKFFVTLLSVKKHSDGRKNKTCGSPGCVNNMVTSAAKSIQKGSDATVKFLKDQDLLITEAQTKLGKGGGIHTVAKGGIYIQAGLVKNTANPYTEKGNHVDVVSFENSPNAKIPAMIFSSKGCAPRSLYLGAPQLTDGDVYLNVSEKFTVNSGSPGIAFETTGIFDVLAGSLELRATEGEIHLSSGNVTTISGKNVRIIGKDNTGDSSIKLSSNHVYVDGSFNVGADLAVKGAVSMDGPLQSPFLIMPSMRASTDQKEPSQLATGTQLMPAVLLRGSSLMKDKITKWALNIGTILRMDTLFSVIQELYDFTLSCTIVDPIISGFGIGTGGCTMGGFVITYDVIWNFRHSHNLFSMDTQFTVPVPLGKYYTQTEGSIAARSVGSRIPTPAPVKGIFPRPGPKSLSGPCGGGGLFTKNRNAEYGLDDLDPFENKNYISQNKNRSVTDSLSGGFIPHISTRRKPNFSGYNPLSGIGISTKGDCD